MKRSLFFVLSRDASEELAWNLSTAEAVQPLLPRICTQSTGSSGLRDSDTETPCKSLSKDWPQVYYLLKNFSRQCVISLWSLELLWQVFITIPFLKHFTINPNLKIETYNQDITVWLYESFWRLPSHLNIGWVADNIPTLQDHSHLAIFYFMFYDCSYLPIICIPITYVHIILDKQQQHIMRSQMYDRDRFQVKLTSFLAQHFPHLSP